MAYTEPGFSVIQDLQQTAVNVKAADQALVLVGPLYEVFEDEVHDQAYDPLTDAGEQTFVWPSKKTTSIVDLASVRKSIAEVDSQLQAGAEYPLAWSLRDPDTSQAFVLDPLTDVQTINQTSFKVAEGVSAAVAKASGSASTAAKDREIHIEAAGLLAAGVKLGQRMRVDYGSFAALGEVLLVHDDNVFFTPDDHDLTVATASLAAAVTLEATGVDATKIHTGGYLIVGSGATQELVEYTSVTAGGIFTVVAMRFAHAVGETIAVKAATLPADIATENADVDMIDAPGYVTLMTGTGLTDKEGSRVVLWIEEKVAEDGTSDGSDGTIIDSVVLALTYADVGKKLSVWSDDAADGATVMTSANYSMASDVLTDTAAPFTADDIGKWVKVDVGSSEYVARIVAFGSTSAVTLATGVVPDGAATADGALCEQVTGVIKSVDSGAAQLDDITAVVTGMSALPVILHRPIYRDLVTDDSNSDTVMRYSGSAVSSDTGYNLHIPVDLYDAALVYEIFPAYELLVTYRALDVASVNRELGVVDSTEVAALGQVSKYNPLLWATSGALVAMGTADTTIIMQPVDLYADVTATGYPEDQQEAQGYMNALDILENNEGAYFMVPLTRNATVRDAFTSHVLAMSEPCDKSERICYLTYALPMGELEATTGQVIPGLESGNKRLVDVGQNFLSEYGVIAGNSVVITAPAAYAGSYTVAADSTEDYLELEDDNWGQTSGVYDDATKEFTDEAADTSAAGTVTGAVVGQWKDVEIGDYVLQATAARRITAIDATFTILTYEGLDLPTLAPAQTVSILRTSAGVEYHVNPLTQSEQASALQAISQGRGQRRVIHMWPDQVEQITGTDAQGNEVREMVSSIYAAAAEAGRDAVIPPQRSSTGMALGGFTGLDNSNFYFKKSQLNTIAEGGWAILHQPVRGGSVIMRHLLTTDMTSVKTQEVSFTKNVDNMVKVKRASMEPLLNDDKGRVNITTQFLAALAVPAQGIFEKFVANEQLVQTEDGPPYTLLSIRQDTTQPDTILEDAELNVPLPANKGVVTFVI